MKLIVGLGNPGKEYENTRHNVGFSFVDSYLSYKKITVSWSNKFDGLFLQTNIDGEKVLFLKPQTYMNLSGNSVRKIVDYFKIDMADILVVSDDLDLKAADYKLAYHTKKEHRGVYTFCMCPGGYVMNAASEEKRLVVNGMSNYKRDNQYANSAILVNVTPDDFGSSHPLAGMYFQRKLEEEAFELGGSDYSIPVQKVEDYLENKERGLEADLETIKKEIEQRDYQDMHRAISPLKKADDAIELDTSNMTLEEVVDQVLTLINKTREE